MVEQLLKEVVEKVVDQAVEEQLLKEALKSTLTSVVDLEVDSNWRVFLAQFGPAVPLLPSVPDFALGEWVSGSQPQVEARSKPKRYQCHMAECMELGRGMADYLHNLVKHFTKFHLQINKDSPYYTKQANFVRFLVVQGSPSSTPPPCISPEVRFLD